MKKYKRKMWEIDIGMKISKKNANINRLNKAINKSVDIMQTIANNKLNPLNCPLSNPIFCSHSF